jgi:hypothetical protein
MPPPSAAAHFWHHCRLRRPRPTPGEAEAPPQARRLPRWALPRSLTNRLLQDGYSADQTAGVLGVLGAGMNPFEQARAAEGGVQSSPRPGGIARPRDRQRDRHGGARRAALPLPGLSGLSENFALAVSGRLLAPGRQSPDPRRERPVRALAAAKPWVNSLAVGLGQAGPPGIELPTAARPRPAPRASAKKPLNPTYYMSLRRLLAGACGLPAPLPAVIAPSETARGPVELCTCYRLTASIPALTRCRGCGSGSVPGPGLARPVPRCLGPKLGPAEACAPATAAGGELGQFWGRADNVPNLTVHADRA